jgi:hypothetical protein
MSNIFAQIEEDQLAQWVINTMSERASAADDLEHGGSQSQRFAPGNVGTYTPAFYICPSASDLTEVFGGRGREFLGHDPWLAKGNYAGCFGANTYLDACPAVQKVGRKARIDALADKVRKPNRGLFQVVMIRGWEDARQADNANKGGAKWKLGWGQGTKDYEIVDGTGHTLAVCEVLGYDSKKDPRGAWTIHVPGSSLFTARYGPNSFGSDRLPICDTSIPKDNPLYCGRAYKDDGNLWAAARSAHPGGVVASTCDGAVRFVSDGINLLTWRALATRAGSDDAHILD